MKTTDLIQQLELSVSAAEEQEARGIEGLICMDADSGRALLDALKRQARGYPDECLPILREALTALERVPTCPVGDCCEDCAMMCGLAAHKLRALVPEAETKAFDASSIPSALFSVTGKPPTGGNNDG